MFHDKDGFSNYRNFLKEGQELRDIIKTRKGRQGFIRSDFVGELSIELEVPEQWSGIFPHKQLTQN